MQTRNFNLLWRGALIATVLLLGWQVLRYNLSEHYLDAAQAGDNAALDTALWWNDGHPRALALKGRQLARAGRVRAAEDYLERAVAANPADARPLVDLAILRAENGAQALADDMMRTANQLMPVHPRVQRDIGIYWIQRGEAAWGLEHLAVALVGDRELWEQFFPVFLAVASDPASRSDLTTITIRPPSWWESFFDYAAREAGSAEPLRSLVAMRKQSPEVPLSARERNTYINRLHRDGLVGQAYLEWVETLEEPALGAMGYVFNGDFELPVSNRGFGWYAREPRGSGIRISRAGTYGSQGEYALHVTFSGKRHRFADLYQQLFLGPGQYRVSGMARPTGLEARRGLEWRLYCSAGEGGVLGQSDLLRGTGNWFEFGFDVEVPQNCAGQTLRLYSAGHRDVDHEVRGGIWFDGLRIQRAAQVTQNQ